LISWIQCEKPEFLNNRVTPLLQERAVRCLLRGTREEITSEAVMLLWVIESPQENSSPKLSPMVSLVWRFLATLLQLAGERVGSPSVDLVLRSHGQHARFLLGMLYEHDRPMLRQDARARLGISESRMSHLLSDLEEACLIHRAAAPKKKGVVLELQRAGRELVSQFGFQPGPHVTTEQESAREKVQEIFSGVEKTLNAILESKLNSVTERLERMEKANQRGHKQLEEAVLALRRYTLQRVSESTGSKYDRSTRRDALTRKLLKS
ncbi:MAG: hypothetical protein SFU86_10770, partial [Pirellulaceae bacterium]|nr:hypothetical protein [Pirellulaceae bacterium]